ncbi:MAG: hypothetical protein ACRELG_23500 [Gemmataceae bacterium]
MKRILLILLFAFSLTLVPALTGRAEAGKGRSYSSGGSSFGKGSSSSFRRGSGGGSSSYRSSGRSYSSGGFSRGKSSPAPSFSKPPAASRPTRSSFDSAAAAAQRKQESKKAFEVRSAPPPSGGISPQGRRYSARPPTPSGMPSGRSYSVSKTVQPGSVKNPAGGSFDSAAAAAQRHQESKTAFTQGTKPRPTYTTPGGETRPLDAGDKRVKEIRRDTDTGRWATREQRRRVLFPNPPPPPVVIYRDPYSNWFWLWLLTRDRDTRALWAYHHQSDMDAARYRDLLAKDQQLQARVRELEAKKAPRDPTYAPPGLDPDLMYDDGFVEAAVNPQPPPPPPPSRRLAGAVWRIVLILAGMAFLVWLVFIKRWGGD